jgi:hypothetical protein
MLKTSWERWPVAPRLTDMTAARRSPLAATVAVLITLLVVLMPASAAAAAMPSTGQLLGKPISHHLAIPAVLRAESATPDLHADATLVAAALLGLALLGWACRRTADTPAYRIAVSAPGSRDPPEPR